MSPFTVKDWKDSPDATTPLSAAALEDLETRVTAYADAHVADASAAHAASAVSFSPTGTIAATDVQAAIAEVASEAGGVGDSVLDWANVVDHGADPTGVSNSSAAFASAYATGKPIYVPDGTFLLSTKVTASTAGRPLRIIGNGPAETIIRQNLNDILFDHFGSQGTQSSLASNAAKGATTVTLSAGGVAASSLAVGDTILIQDDGLWVNTGIDSNSAKNGELALITAIAGEVLTLGAPLSAAYTTANAAKVRELTMQQGGYVLNCTVENAAPDTRSNTSYLFKLWRTRDFLIDRVIFKGFDGAAVFLQDSIDFRVSRCKFQDGSFNTGAGRFSYGIQFFGACQDGVVESCKFQRHRHATTTSQTTSYGIPRRIKHKGCFAVGNVTAFDTHFEGEYIDFEDCHAYGGLSAGFHLRAPRSRLDRCSVNGVMDVGVRIRGGDAIVDVDIDGVVASGDMGLTGQGVRIESNAETSRLEYGMICRARVRSTAAEGYYNSSVNYCRVDLDVASTTGVSINLTGTSAHHVLSGTRKTASSAAKTVGGSVTDVVDQMTAWA